MNTVYRRTYDMFVRPGTSDDFICDESEVYLPLFLNTNEYDVCLDIGANIGSFMKLANNNFDGNVLGYEPEPENYKMLIKNFGLNYYYYDINKSAIGTGNKDVNFLVSNDGFKAKHSTKNRQFKKGFTEIKVKQLDFLEQIKLNEATLLKIDIEGGEYDLQLENLPEKIKGIAIEFHLIDNNHRQMFNLYNLIADQFSYQVGEMPINNIDWFIDTFNNQDDAFMVIFLRNT